MPTEGPFQPGDVCEKYRIVRVIAAGGQGVVYEAEHVHLGRRVALKCLPTEYAKSETLRRRMELEGKVLSSIQHANVVLVYDASFTQEGVYFIAMDLLQGCTLREELRKRLPLERALYIAHQIADGIQAAHEKGVVHRDLKPDNVFLTSAYEVKVLDFGIAKFRDYGAPITRERLVPGTAQYLSPEQILGKERLDGRVDIFALGVILYEMAAGVHPFLDEDGFFPPNQELFCHVVQKQPTPLAQLIEGFPIAVSHVIEAAMAKHRRDRFPTMADLSTALRTCRERLIAEGGADPRPGVIAKKVILEDDTPASPFEAIGRGAPSASSVSVSSPSVEGWAPAGRPSWGPKLNRWENIAARVIGGVVGILAAVHFGWKAFHDIAPGAAPAAAQAQANVVPEPATQPSLPALVALAPVAPSPLPSPDALVAAPSDAPASPLPAPTPRSSRATTSARAPAHGRPSAPPVAPAASGPAASNAEADLGNPLLVGSGLPGSPIRRKPSAPPKVDLSRIPGL